MNNTLTAKEWLEKEGVFPYNHFTIEGDINKMPRTEELLEKYANYKNSILENRIKEFNKLLANERNWCIKDSITIGNKMHNLLTTYNEHFNIRKE